MLQRSQGLEEKLKVLRGLQLPEEMARLEEGRRPKQRIGLFDKYLIADFVRRVHIRNDTDCWEWIGARTPKQYGLFYLNGKAIPAHRVSKSLQIKKQTTCECVCHHCDVAWCVNPNHLYEGNKTTNGKDAKERGRIKRLSGEQCGASKLNNSSVIEIRKLFSSKQINSPDLSKKFGVSLRTIWRVILRETWRHI